MIEGTVAVGVIGELVHVRVEETGKDIMIMTSAKATDLASLLFRAALDIESRAE